MSDLPEPLVAADVDLHGYGFMPLYGHRLFGSEFNARCSDAEWRAGVTLWWAAWNQVPAASLPNDDAALCRLADLGRDVRAWRKIRTNALHGFILCSDGRLYHKALSEYALQAWDRRVKDRARKERWRAGRNADGDGDRTVPETGTDTGTTTVTDASRNEDGTAERDRDRDSESSKKEPSNNHSGNLPTVGAPQASPKHKTGSRLPDDWPLTDRLRAVATHCRTDAGLPPIDVMTEHAKFVDYWHAKAGKDARKLDWVGTWRNWIRNARAPNARDAGGFGAGMRQQIADALSMIEPEEAPQWPALPPN